MTLFNEARLSLVACDTKALVEIGLLLRHQVFSEEKGFEQVKESERETDKYDVCAKHFLLRDENTGLHIGYFRLLSKLTDNVLGAPYKKDEYCPSISGVSVEISRFLILPSFRCSGNLQQAFTLISDALKSFDTSAYILIERRLGMALRREKYNIKEVSRTIQFRGERAVYFCVNPNLSDAPLLSPNTSVENETETEAVA